MTLDKKQTKYCKHCGEKILKEAVICIHCGLQVEELKQSERIIINNSNAGSRGYVRKAKNKWVSLALCVFLGVLGGHKFYEGKQGLGVLYMFTAGLFGIGLLVDIITILFKENPYYV